MSHLNSVRVLADRPLRAGGTKTTSVEKIDNGYLTRVSEYDDRGGGFKSSTVYSADVPNGEASSSRSGVGCEDLSDTKKYLGNDV